jgi:hypothetical protein
VTIALSDAFPHIFLSSFNKDPSTTVIKSKFVRSDEYDPYGFNSILSRFHKRSKLYGIDKDKTYFPKEINFV